MKVVIRLIVLFALAVFVFGKAVQVPFLEPSVSFPQAIRSLDADRALHSFSGDKLGNSLMCSGALLLACSFVRSCKIRMALFAGGFVIPLFLTEPVFVCVTFISPLLIGSALFASPDGEFYGEDMLPAAAVGLLMLTCLVCALRELWLWRKNFKQPAAP